MTCTELPKHDTDPGLKVLLHALAAALKQVLDALYFGLELFKLVVLVLVLKLQFVRLRLQLLLLRCLENLTGGVDEAAHGVLFADLLYLVRQSFDLVAAFIDVVAQLLATSILLFEQSSVLLHGLVLAVGFSEEVEGPCSVGKVLGCAGDGRCDKGVDLSCLAVKSRHWTFFSSLRGVLLLYNFLIQGCLGLFEGHGVGSTLHGDADRRSVISSFLLVQMVKQDGDLVVALLDQELEPLHLSLHLFDLFAVSWCLLLRRLHLNVAEVRPRVAHSRRAARASLLLLHVGVEVLEVIEALIDHQTIGKYDVLARV